MGPKIWEWLTPACTADAEKHASPHESYLVEFHHSWSHGTSGTHGDPQEKWACRVPPFKVTQGHRN